MLEAITSGALQRRPGLRERGHHDGHPELGGDRLHAEGSLRLLVDHYRAKWKSSPYVELETVQYEPPRTWTMHNGGPIEVTFTCTLEPVREGTRLHAEFQPRPHGWFRLIFPLFVLMIRREEKANMGHIREAVERRQHTGPQQ